MICPICQSSDAHLLRTLCQNAQVLGDCFPPEKIHIASCPKCGMVYLRSGLTQSDYTNYYATIAASPMYYNLFGKEESDAYFGHIYQCIKKYLAPGRGNVLDVAGSWGELGAYLEHSDTDIQVTVLDISDRCLQSCTDKGLRSVKADIAATMERSEELYDIVIANHTLEHIFDLRTAMHNIRQLLKDDGVVYVELPDASQYSTDDTPPFFFVTLEHVAHFTAETFQNLAAVTGFELVESGTYYKKVSKYPSIWAVLKKGPVLTCKTPQKAEDDAMREYLQSSAEIMRQRLAVYEKSQQELILWGIGASTILFLDSFAKCNIVGIVDANKQKQGVKYEIGSRTLQIGDPASVAAQPKADIFVLSEVYKDAIKRQIQEMGLSNRVFSW